MLRIMETLLIEGRRLFWMDLDRNNAELEEERGNEDNFCERCGAEVCGK